MSPIPVTVAILSFNEEVNLPYALDSIQGWASDVLVVDAGSSDRTRAIAESRACRVIENSFLDYSQQRNFALRSAAITTEWVFFLDADEWLPRELRREIGDTLARAPVEDGFLVKYRLMWLGHWVRRGYYPTWLLRLVRKDRARCEGRGINEHLVVSGTVAKLREDLIHEDRKPLGEWILKHNRYADREARLLLERCEPDDVLTPRFLGRQAERKRWMRERFWKRMPPVVRALLYFAYRYFIRGGFLDGLAGFSFHFLQGLWYPLLIDLKYLELKRRATTQGPNDT